MVKVRKFKGYCANKDDIEKIISPPYDVWSTKEAREETGDNEMYYFHVNKPSIDLPDGATEDEIAQKGKENLENFIEKGYLVQDDEERIYIYAQQMGDHVQYGILCLASIEDYENGLIKKHEQTLPAKEAERTNLWDTQGANAGPTFFSYNGGEDIRKKVSEVIESEPYGQVTTKDGVIHTLWKWNSEDSDFIVTGFESIPCMYIADGHHRSAAAFNVGVKRRQRAIDAGLEVTGEESFNYFMTVIFPADEWKIYDYNRVLKTLNDFSVEEFMEKLAASFTITQIEREDPKPTSKGHISLYINEKWYDMEVKEEIKTGDPAKDLDYQVLSDHWFLGILGIENIKKDGRVAFVGGGRGMSELEKRCHDDWVAAFAMYPLEMDDMCKVADAGLKLPPKCTWFEPKLRSGFVVNVFDK